MYALSGPARAVLLMDVDLFKLTSWWSVSERVRAGGPCFFGSSTYTRISWTAPARCTVPAGTSYSTKSQWGVFGTGRRARRAVPTNTDSTEVEGDDAPAAGGKEGNEDEEALGGMGGRL